MLESEFQIGDSGEPFIACRLSRKKMKKFIVPAVLLLSAFAIGFYQPQLGMARNNTTVICHVTHGGAEEMTISVNEKALAAHLAHGDVVDACSP